MNKTAKAITVPNAIRSQEWKLLFAGLAFAFLWASASTATKIRL